MSDPLFDEAVRLIDEARKFGLDLRLLGGTAVKWHCPNAAHRALARECGDLDAVVPKKQGRNVNKFFASIGYEANEHFNAVHGAERKEFFLQLPSTDGQPKEVKVDVFMGIFKMCHVMEIGDRLAGELYTIPLAELLLTKLQIFEINEKDIQDIVALLLDHEVGKGDNETINVDEFTKPLAEDWGFCKTITLNLEKVRKYAETKDFAESERSAILSRIDKLLEAIEARPKSLKWKMRARVGERMRWYELPESRA